MWKRVFGHMRTAKTQISLRLCAVWSDPYYPPTDSFDTAKYMSGEQTLRKLALFKYIENFTTKNWKFSDKSSDIFHISAQNIDCGYSLEPPRRGGSNEYLQSIFWAEIRKLMYTPVNPSFTI